MWRAGANRRTVVAGAGFLGGMPRAAAGAVATVLARRDPERRAPRPPAARRGKARRIRGAGDGGDARGWGARLGRVLVAVLSLAVLVTVGYGWAQLHGSGVQLATSDVITPRPGGTGAGGAAGAQNILLVGLDTRTDALGNPLPPAVLDALHAGVVADGGDSTDTMIVVHVPAGGGAVTGFPIPRDSYVDIPGYGTHKINSAYAYGQNAARTTLSAQGLSGPVLAVQTAAAGARTAIATVEQLTGLRIDHYAAVNLAGFAAISQAVGGVPVCRPGGRPVFRGGVPGRAADRDRARRVGVRVPAPRPTRR